MKNQRKNEYIIIANTLLIFKRNEQICVYIKIYEFKYITFINQAFQSKLGFIAFSLRWLWIAVEEALLQIHWPRRLLALACLKQRHRLNAVDIAQRYHYKRSALPDANTWPRMELS